MINIIEILKDCPKGTKLYSPICGNCKLLKIYNGLGFDVINDINEVFNFSYDGRYNLNGECCIFPSKENRDWNTFRSFKDGDIISNDAYIAIFHKFGKPQRCEYDKVIYYHCWYHSKFKESKFKKDFGIGRDTEYRFATDEEKQKLFDVIKTNGYKWNAETKTLEKLIVPKFKVSDKIVKKDDPAKSWYVQGIATDYYIITKGQVSNLHFKDQDEWELVPNKFDISTLKAYDKVLVRDDNNSAWINTFFGFHDTMTNKKYSFIAGTVNWSQCIPYEGNEHLLGTYDDCDDYFKNW